MQVDFLVFETTPESFDENVVEDPAAAVHADGDPMLGQEAEPAGAGKLHPLIGVADLGRRVRVQRPPKGAHAEVALQAIAELPSQHETARTSPSRQRGTRSRPSGRCR